MRSVPFYPRAAGPQGNPCGACCARPWSPAFPPRVRDLPSRTPTQTKGEPTVKFQEALATSEALLAQGLSVLISGPPGIGKSALAETLAKRRGWRLITSQPVISDPTDFKGLPFVVDGHAEFLPFGDLLDLIGTDVETLWHFDDLIQAPA